MKSRILSLALAIVMLTCVVQISVFAFDGIQYVNTGLYYTISGGKVAISDCDTSLTTVTIPNKIEGYPVTSIGKNAFLGCDSLQTVYYCGSESDFAALTVESGNTAFASKVIYHTSHVYDDSCDTNCNVCGFYRNIKATVGSNSAFRGNNVTLYISLSAIEELAYTNGSIAFDELPEGITLKSGAWSVPVNSGGMNIKNFTKSNMKGVFTLDEFVTLPDVSVQYGNIFTATFTVAKNCSFGEKTISANINLRGVNGRIPVENISGTITVNCNHSGAQPTSYGCDAENHWSICNICSNKIETTTAAHVYDSACDTICNTCEYVRVAPHSTDGNWLSDENTHWQYCDGCEQNVFAAAHVYDNAFDDTCNVCGYERSVSQGIDGEKKYEYDSAKGKLSVDIEGVIPSYSKGNSPFNVAGVTKIELSDNITGIGANAFAELENLESIEILGNPEISANALPTGITVYGWSNTNVSEFCENNDITFVGLESFEGACYQQGTTEKNKFRFISEMGNAEYLRAAGYEITATGVSDSGADISKKKPMNVSVSSVYKSISGSGSAGIEEYYATEGKYLSAFSMSGLPQFTKDGYIRFNIKSYVVNPYSSEKIYTDEITLQYDKSGVHV